MMHVCRWFYQMDLVDRRGSGELPVVRVLVVALLLLLGVIGGCSSPRDAGQGTSDAGVDLAGVADLSSPPDLASPRPTVSCLTEACDVNAGVVCCNGAAANPSETLCQPAGDACKNWILACDSPDDCPGQRCCATRSPAYTGSYCADNCAADSSPTVTICASSADCKGQVCGKGFWFGLDDCGM